MKPEISTPPATRPSIDLHDSRFLVYHHPIVANGFAFALPSPRMSAAIIALRETFETTLIVGVILTVLHRTNRRTLVPMVWLGVTAGVAASIALAFGIHTLGSSLSGNAEPLYEGIMMFVAAALLSWMILWMAAYGHSMQHTLKAETLSHAERGSLFGLFLLAFTSTAREGAEMVLLIYSSLLSSKENMHALAGALAGITAAIVLAVILMRGIARVPVGLFFRITGGLLLVLGAWLVASGSHELIEAAAYPLSELVEEGIPLAAGLLYLVSMGTLWVRAGKRR